MKHSTKFILALCGIFLTIIGAILLLHKTVSDSLLSSNIKSTPYETPLVEVETKPGETSEETIKNPFEEIGGLNFDFGAIGDKSSPDEEKRENEPSVNREGHDSTSGSSTGEEIFTESGREVVHFDYCKDGDTIAVTKGNGEAITIRFIGVNTPESVAPEEYTKKTGKDNNDYGKLSSKHAKELFKDADILYLEYDQNKTDPYERTLAYVYFTDSGDLGDMANAKMIKDGYASVMSIAPNTKYADSFQVLQNEAMAENKGLWQYAEFRNNYEKY